MTFILAGIDSLAQHINQINFHPEAYRPTCCPHCTSATLWSHGCYQRNADRENSGSDSLNPIPILRFICAHSECGKTCSVLPECIAPRRHYLWSIQQAVLLLLLTGKLDAEQDRPHVRTVWRWWARLKACFDLHRYHLVDHDSRFGQYTSVADFWLFCLLHGSLSKAMLAFHQRGVCVP